MVKFFDVFGSGEWERGLKEMGFLPNSDNSLTDIQKMERELNNKFMTDEARKEAMSVLNTLKNTGENNSGYATAYDYLKCVLELPFEKETFAAPEISGVIEALDVDNYGMKKVKNAIIGSLSAMILKRSFSGRIYLLVGAPGVGKTSLSQSVARALGRRSYRVSLGGISDESAIRGHRRTYIGSMEGRIINAVRKCGVTNPVLILDEIDKISQSNHGDPAAALLEVLDPEQNSSFTDHYLNFPYDLSDVLFICTANSLENIPQPLLDRMEVIHVDSYTMEEKVHIAKRHLLPKSIERSGIPKNTLKISDNALKSIIDDYTFEGGVRNLGRCLDTICSNVALKILQGGITKVTIKPLDLREYLSGNPMPDRKALKSPLTGVSTGLAWTENGGHILFIETMFSKGTGKLNITGNLGSVMKESVMMAISIVKAAYPDKAELFEKNDLHIHVPDGAVPKDGPSAGITLVTALASLVTGKPVDCRLAMTGEVSLRGAVTAIGGLVEKLEGAKRAGIKKVLIPEGNTAGLEDVSEEIKKGLEIIPVSSVSEALRITGMAETDKVSHSLYNHKAKSDSSVSISA